MAKKTDPKLKVTETKAKPTNTLLDAAKPPDLSSLFSGNTPPLISVPDTEFPPTPDPAPTAPTGPNYDQLRAEGGAYYDNQYNEYSNKAKADAEASKAMTSEQYAELLRQAYVSNMQNQKKMGDNLAAAGIRGGGSETANLKLMTGYQNTRNKTNTEKQSALAGIDKTMNDNIFNFKMQNDQAKNAYMQQIGSEERQRGMTMEEWAREDLRTKEEREYQDKVTQGDREYQDRVRAEGEAREDQLKAQQDQADAYNAYYATFKTVDALKRARDKAKTPAQKAAIDKAIANINATSDAKKSERFKKRYSRIWDEKALIKAYKNSKDSIERDEISLRLGYVREYNKKNKK